MITTNFNTQRFIDLPTGQIYMFCMDRIINSFISIYSVILLVFYNLDDVYVLQGTK
jgi:hypothetical protein